VVAVSELLRFLLLYWAIGKPCFLKVLGWSRESLPHLPCLVLLPALYLCGLKCRALLLHLLPLPLFLGTAVIFYGLFPNVMPSSLNEAYNLTIYNASSSQMTLKIMTIVALFFVPIVLAYQGWSYYIFAKRIGRSDIPKE
jgi:cytochrome bd ubiquinol oxidase subunit II